MRRKVCSKKCSSPENMQGKGQGSELRAQGSGLREPPGQVNVKLA